MPVLVFTLAIAVGTGVLFGLIPALQISRDSVSDALAAGRMLEHIELFLNHWLDAMSLNHRSYVTVAIGCTGGQHRSVYLAEWLGRAFAGQARVLIRHRTLAGG